ncbi:TadE family protein [Zafaria sp. Z1313]|uniref:TadE family protein n=1 Tax=Zafaria sp. Z1313 TaxID=3423202 RepID=UPI003D3036BE
MHQGPPEAARPGQDGSAVAEFVMVVALLTAVFLSVVQLALVLHVRNTLVDAAAAGARYGTLADRSPAEGAQRTRDIIGSSLSQAFAHGVSHETGTSGGQPSLRITVDTHLPLIGFLPLFGTLEVHGEAVRYG